MCIVSHGRPNGQLQRRFPMLQKDYRVIGVDRETEGNTILGAGYWMASTYVLITSNLRKTVIFGFTIN
jgi:hypothetical protein